MRHIITIFLFLLLLTLLGCATSTTTLRAIPKGESEFNLASDELLDHYADIKKYHNAYLQPFQAKPELRDLEQQWGKPDSRKRESFNALSGVYAGAVLGILISPAAWVVLPVAGASYLSQTTAPTSRAIWEKGDYQVEAITKRSRGTEVISSWNWRYRGVEEYTPILARQQRKGSYYLGAESGRAMGFFVSTNDPSLNKARNVSLMLGRKLPSAIANLDFLFDIGWQWQNGKSGDADLQWIRYPVRFIPTYHFTRAKTSVGVGVVSVFDTVLLMNQKRFSVEDINPGYVFQTAYHYSPNFLFGISITTTKPVSFQQDRYDLSVVNSFINLYF